MDLASWVTLISVAVTVLFMPGVPVLLVIAYWVIGCSFVLGLTLDNMGSELINVFNKGFALLAIPLFILIGYPVNKLMRNDPTKPVADKGWSEMIVVEGFKIPEVPSIVVRLAPITGILAPLIAISVVMQQIMSLLGAQAVIGNFVTSMGGYYAVLFTAIIIVFVAGIVLESLPVTIILAPILAPVAMLVGVDPIHFAVTFLVGASIGFVTPPYGLNFYVASGVTGVP